MTAKQITNAIEALRNDPESVQDAFGMRRALSSEALAKHVGEQLAICGVMEEAEFRRSLRLAYTFVALGIQIGRRIGFDDAMFGPKP